IVFSVNTTTPIFIKQETSLFAGISDKVTFHIKESPSSREPEYWEFCELIQNTIGGDCWAMTVQRDMVVEYHLSQKEIIWNSYRVRLN
ncbi:MAG: hypothetical protein EBU93_03115, partial [Chlamydiae bacterium]|nr:hypothetical protein [Chlamydiota bacterium]